MLDMVHGSVWCMTWSFHLSYAWYGLIICLLQDMVLLSVLYPTWSTVLNSFTHATNQWYMQCMLSIYDILSIIDVTGVRCERWSAPLRYSWSLLDVRWWRWLGIVMVTYIINSVMHPLIIKSFLNSFIQLLLRMRTCRRLNVIIIAGSIPSLDCGTVLLNLAGRIWCKMATMIVMMMAMVMIMLAIVVIVMVIFIVTPSSVDSCCHWLVHCCNVKHVHLLHVRYHHYCRSSRSQECGTTDTGWIELAQGGLLCVRSQFSTCIPQLS